jgi:hypothetical protein
MKQLTVCAGSLRDARGLPAVLDAACDAFEAILAVIGDYEDTSGADITFLLAATQAANGRDAVLFAPSLPPRALHHPAPAERPGRPSAQDIKTAAAGLSALLATRLAPTATTAAAHADRSACQDAARYATRIRDLLAGQQP